MDTNSTPEPHELISRSEAAQMLSVELHDINGMTLRGELHAWRINDDLMLRRQEVLEHLMRSHGFVPAGSKP
ncbi:hypothetical protein [Mycolicibacterium brisbanense]